MCPAIGLKIPKLCVKNVFLIKVHSEPQRDFLLPGVVSNPKTNIRTNTVKPQGGSHRDKNKKIRIFLVRGGNIARSIL